MEESPEFLVRDHRMPGHFWADNEVLDVYGEKLGFAAFAVYMVLCRNATNGTGECRISMRKVGKIFGMSTGGVFNALTEILQLGLARQVDPGDNRHPAVYVLADVKSLTDPALAQMRLKKNSVHTVNAEAISVHGMNAETGQRSSDERSVHTVNPAFTPRTRNKESKRLSTRLSTRGGETETPAPKYSQADFDERDLRKMGEAFREADLHPSSVGSDPDERFLWVCLRAGISVERGLALQAKQMEWLQQRKISRQCKTCAGSGKIDDDFGGGFCNCAAGVKAKENQASIDWVKSYVAKHPERASDFGRLAGGSQ